MLDPRVAARDAGLRRVSWLTRGAMAGGLALTGVFSAVAAHAFPGRTVRRTAVPPTTEPPTTTTTAPPPTTTTAAPLSRPGVHRTLQPPVTAPRPIVTRPVPVAPAPLPVRRVVRPHVVSGGS